MVLYITSIFYSGNNVKKLIDVRNKNALRYSGWDPSKKNVIIIHGFNGTESKTPMTIIRNGKYLIYILHIYHHHNNINYVALVTNCYYFTA